MVDCIAPSDIGAVAGTVLVKGVPQDGNRKIYLYGPELLTQRQCVDVMAKVLDKKPEIEIAGEQDAYRMFVEERKVPEALAKYMVERAGRLSTKDRIQVFGYELTEDQLRNVETYSGKKGTGFEEWMEKNKEVFIA